LLQPEFFDVGLTNGHQYWYRVRTVDSAGRTTLDSGSSVVAATPSDTVPPGALTEIFADPDRPVGAIRVSWNKGLDEDIGQYQVYRSGVAGSTGAQVGMVTVASGQDRYEFVDNVSQGANYYYSVKVIDSSGNPSQLSPQASARPRNSGITAPQLTTSGFEIFTNGTTSTDGLVGPNRDAPDTTAENDDVIRVHLAWSSSANASSGYRIYRKAVDETRYVSVGSVSAGTTVFYDASVTKSDYTYFVVGVGPVGGTSEAKVAALSAPGRSIRASDIDFLHAMAPATTVTGDRLPSLAQAERTHIVRVLEATDWNKKEASRVLDISRGTLYRKILEYQLEPEPRPAGRRSRDAEG
jgi:hypothetical protein